MMSLRSLSLAAVASLAWLAGAVAPAQAGPSTPDDQRRFQEQADTANQRFREAGAALAAGKIDEAEAKFVEARKLAPDATGPVIGLAEVAVRRGDAAAAEKLLREAVAMAPDAAEPYSALARFLASQRRFPEAADGFRKAAELDPASSADRIALGEIYLAALNDPQKAIEAYRSATLIDSGSFPAHFGLASAALRLNQLDVARWEYEAAARAAPANPLPVYMLGTLALRSNDAGAALAAFDRALAIKSDYVPAMIGRGDVLARKGENDAALAAYAAALKLDAKAVGALIGTAQAQQATGKAREAAKTYRAVLALDDKQTVALNNLAWILAEQKTDLDEALGSAKRAVELVPQVPTFKDTLAWVLRARGELPQSLDVLQPLSKVEPPNPEILTHFGTVLADLGRKKEAIEALNQALAVAPDYAAAQAELKRVSALR